MRVGYYRVKLKATNRVVNIYNGNIIYTTAEIKTQNKIDSCSSDINENGKYIKYLDRFGRYRFWMFNNKWKEQIQPTSKGEYNVNVMRLIDAQSNKKQIGSSNVKTITLRCENVTREQLEILQDIYASPRIYYRIGQNDFVKDWLLVKLTGDNVTSDRTKNSFNMEVTITLPEYFSICKY
jgi:hypothetical protein